MATAIVTNTIRSDVTASTSSVSQPVLVDVISLSSVPSPQPIMMTPPSLMDVTTSGLTPTLDIDESKALVVHSAHCSTPGAVLAG